MNELTKAQECIEMLYTVLKGIQIDKNPCIMDHYTMIKGYKYDPDWVKQIRDMEG